MTKLQENNYFYIRPGEVVGRVYLKRSLHRTGYVWTPYASSAPVSRKFWPTPEAAVAGLTGGRLVQAPSQPDAQIIANTEKRAATLVPPPPT